MIDEILEKLGLKYDDLTAQERDTLDSWMQNLQKGSLQLADVKNYIQKMRDSVETELTKIGHNSKQDLFLKARLRNYMMLEAYLTSPEKAKQALERSITSLVSKA